MQVSLCDAVGLSLLMQGISLYYVSMWQLESSLFCDSPLFHQVLVNIQVSLSVELLYEPMISPMQPVRCVLNHPDMITENFE